MWIVVTTLTKTEIIYPKNVDAQGAMDFTQDKYSAPRTIEKMKILGAVLELPAKHGHHAHLPQNWAKLANSAVLFS